MIFDEVIVPQIRTMEEALLEIIAVVLTLQRNTFKYPVI